MYTVSPLYHPRAKFLARYSITYKLEKDYNITFLRSCFRISFESKWRRIRVYIRRYKKKMWKICLKTDTRFVWKILRTRARNFVTKAEQIFSYAKGKKRNYFKKLIKFARFSPSRNYRISIDRDTKRGRMHNSSRRTTTYLYVSSHRLRIS